MRLRLRVRTVLVLVALVGIPLGYAAVRWRRAGFAFQMRHAYRANAYWGLAWREGDNAEYRRRHATPGHSCAVCQRWERPADELVAESLRRQAEYRRAARWHALIAGTAINDERFFIEL